jgi:predicted nucleotidyltransferase
MAHCHVWIPTMTDAGEIIATLRGALPGLRTRWPIRSLALFGSRVRDDAAPGSDLDVLVEFTRPIALSSFLALEARLAAITGLPVDLVSTAALKPYIGERVRTEAVDL